ncbi:uroporphyrinogen decarboxylase [Reichenbachiella agarivorans]|uniref:Uroporphyrinogen decarboxylase n=1 Tax=Reichenbachiella agarivorans TaxID=2979464 RepID=A0ABY6CS67_9BACT|nr:uroporphyrinogen decarboxylase [Reichenbachiella agarivorans]UXP32288.1 uroporphyrinogen decarboxylase [Reichenbachiella agarivorans]
MTLKNDLLIRAAKGEKVERIPVWLMRQAGRILPEYRQVRESVSGFIELAKTPELAAEVTIQPVDILGVDAAIIFSDILVIPEAMGLPYQMIEKRGPWFENTIEKQSDLSKIRIAKPEDDLAYVLDAIKITKERLEGRVPLIGFAGAPWTIFSYMVEGAGSKTFSKAKKMLYAEPMLSHQLLEMITESTILYLKAQVKAGVDLVQIFDSWAGILSPRQYEEFGLKYIQQICDAIDEVPITVFAKGAFFARQGMGQLNCETIGLDWNMDVVESRQLIGGSKTLQGNLDPCVLYSSHAEIERRTIEMLQSFGGHQHIANLGHGVYPDINPEKVKTFINTVKNWRAN